MNKKIPEEDEEDDTAYSERSGEKNSSVDLLPVVSGCFVIICKGLLVFSSVKFCFFENIEKLNYLYYIVLYYILLYFFLYLYM